MVKSNITYKTYDPSHAVYISNMKQACLYLRNNANLLDILYERTKSDMLVFVFERNDLLRHLYEKWNNRQLT